MTDAVAVFVTPECKAFATWDPEAKRWACLHACGASGPAGWLVDGSEDLELAIVRHHPADAAPIEVYFLDIDDKPMTPEGILAFAPGIVLGSLVRVADDVELEEVSQRSAEEIKRGFLTGEVIDVFQNALENGEPFNVGGLLAVTHSKVRVVRL